MGEFAVLEISFYLLVNFIVFFGDGRLMYDNDDVRTGYMDGWRDGYH